MAQARAWEELDSTVHRTGGRGAVVMPDSISEVTRRSVLDYISASGINWSGRLAEDEFLTRLYDLADMPSTDYRVSDAAGDIRQHRVNWRDWDDDWVFYDPRFNVLRAPDEEFLRFLAETVHPVVRPDEEEASEMVAAYNRELEADGWRLIEGKQISGRAVFVAEKQGARAKVFDAPTGWQRVDRQLQEVRLRLDTAKSEEQFQTVGLLCREALISVAQAVFDPAQHPVADGVAPSDTDAARMLEAFLKQELRGSANEAARAHAKAALKFALALQHKRTADFRMAALCAEATSSIVNIAAVISGKRVPASSVVERIETTPFVESGMAQLRITNTGNTSLRCQVQMTDMVPAPSKPERLPYGLRWKGHEAAIFEILPGASGVLEIAKQVSSNGESRENVLRLLSAESGDGRFTVTAGFGTSVECEIGIASDPPLSEGGRSRYKMTIGNDGGIASFS